MVKFTLDGSEVEVAPGTTILKAARAADIDVPTFCYLDGISIQASCRMCLIEIEGRRKLEPACATVVAADMVVHTRSDRVVGAREDMLEILLANHPLDCPICDKGGECELQDTVYEYGKGDSRLFDEKRVFRSHDINLNDVIIFNAQRCIQCQRCVRVCEEVVGEVALGTAERGLDSEITGVGNSLKDCSHCGNCIEVCPVGALMSTPYRYKARPWDLVKTETICNMCGTGCSLTIETREGALSRVKSDPATGLNHEYLCAKGRFGFDSIDGGTRIREPMIRKGGTLSPVSWEEAIGFIAARAKHIQSTGGQIQGLVSPRQTNEVAYGFGQLMREGFKADTVHASCRFGGLEASAAKSLKALLASRYSRQPLATLLTADCILLLGANLTEENPVSGYQIRASLRDHGTPLFVATSRPLGLDDIAHASLRLRPGDEAHVLAALTRDEAGPCDDDLADFAALAKPVIAGAETVTLLIGTEFLRTSAAATCLGWIEAAARRLEARGKAVSVQFLFDRPNQLGLWDMGCLPDARASAVPEMLFVLGADPIAICADGDPLESAAQQTACLVVQDSHMSKTAAIATVLLPAPSYGEESGTYTNNEGRVQRVHSVRDRAPGVLATLEALHRIARAMDVEPGLQEPRQVFAAIAANIPAYQGLDMEADGNDLGLTLTLPPLEEPVHEPALTAMDDPAKGYSLITGDSMFHSGTLSERSKILTSIGDGAYVEMNPGAGFESNSEGYFATVSRLGTSLTARLKVNTSFAEGVVYIPENLLIAATGKLLDVSYPCAVKVKVFQKQTLAAE